MTMDYPEVFLYVVCAVVLGAFPFSCCIVYFCSDTHPEEQRNADADALAQLAVAVEQTRTLAATEQARRLAAAAAAVEQARRLAVAAAAAEQAGRLAAAAAAPVVKKELGYFPYSAAVEGGSGRASGERQLVCAICLEVFVPGATCSEVPACRHFFHRDCIGTWMKNSKSTCPLCRALIVPGSERLSAAEDMV